MDDRKIGRVKINHKLIMNDITHVYDIFAFLKFTPIRVEDLQHIDVFEYIGFSEKFELLLNGQKIPEYELIISQKIDGTIKSVAVEKIQQEV